MTRKGLTVVALGGNAISRENEEGNVAQQFANSAATAKQLADLIGQGFPLVITHGNGPQIGNFLLRNEAGAGLIYPLPMEVAVAHVQGGMGFMIAQAMTNELARRGDPKIVTAIVTTVLVDEHDPAFQNPTKPVGRVMNQQDAVKFSGEEGWSVKEISPGKFRRVVPSPAPTQIMEIDMIRRAVQAGDLLVVCGGGGVPVIRKNGRDLCGTRAVIDKDLASALLAAQLGAETLLILTAVDRICIDFGKPTQHSLETMSIAEAESHLNTGQFPAGSMGPKVQGAVNFLKSANNPHARAIIGPLDRAADAMSGKIGTAITPS
ncbi:MAG: carbamate kinase [Planctomycetota bacterium]